MHTECTDTMSAKLSSLRKRLAKLEQEQADRAKVVELANCNCPELKCAVPFLAVCPAKLEAEMNKTCPVHGLRRFGQIAILDFVNLDGTTSEETIKLEQLIDSHNLRLAQHSHASITAEKENDSKEP
jgi:hypothetical protein